MRTSSQSFAARRRSASVIPGRGSRPAGTNVRGAVRTTTLWDRREALHQSRLADSTTIFNPALTKAVAGLHQLGLPDLGAKASIARTMVGQSYLMAADDIFYISGWLCFILIAMVWLCRPAKSGGGAPVAAD